MSEELETKRCAHCSTWIPGEATMCANCGTSDVDGARAGVKPGTLPVKQVKLPRGWTVTRVLIWTNGIYLLWCMFVQRSFTPDRSALESLVSFTGLNQGLYVAGGYSPAAVAEGQWWRAFTAFFLHAGIFHIGMNMWVLSTAGRLLEEIVGTARFLTIYLVSGLGSTLAITIWHVMIMHSRNPPWMVGASGAVFGVLGALMVIGFRSKSSRGRAFGSMLARDLVFMIILGLMIEMVSNTGHVGGLIPGIAFGLTINERFAGRLAPRTQRIWQIVAGLLVAATVIALALGVAFSLEVIGGRR